MYLIHHMEFNVLQDKVVKNAQNYGKRFNVSIDKQFAFLKLIEEVGEFAEAVLIYNKKSRPEKHLSSEDAQKKIAEELADVIGMAIVNAHLLEIDLEKSINEKWINKKRG